MDDHHSIMEGLASNLSFKARLVVAIVAVALLLQLVFLIIAILRSIIYALIDILNVFVLWPIWILFGVLRVPMTLLKLVIMGLAWAVCSLARGVMAIFMLFGLRDGRTGRAKTGGGGDILESSRQEANLAFVQDMGMVRRGPQGWQMHIILSDRPVRGGHNIGFIMGGMDGTEVWQPTTLGGDGLMNQKRLVQRWITAQG